MTPVQAGSIPRALKNQDCVVEVSFHTCPQIFCEADPQAVTGSGKTLAFVIPVLERMIRNEHKYKKGEVAALVIAPTRSVSSSLERWQS